MSQIIIPVEQDHFNKIKDGKVKFAVADNIAPGDIILFQCLPGEIFTKPVTFVQTIDEITIGSFPEVTLI